MDEARGLAVGFRLDIPQALVPRKARIWRTSGLT